MQHDELLGHTTEYASMITRIYTRLFLACLSRPVAQRVVGYPYSLDSVCHFRYRFELRIASWCYVVSFKVRIWSYCLAVRLLAADECAPAASGAQLLAACVLAAFPGLSWWTRPLFICVPLVLTLGPRPPYWYHGWRNSLDLHGVASLCFADKGGCVYLMVFLRRGIFPLYWLTLGLGPKCETGAWGPVCQQWFLDP